MLKCECGQACLAWLLDQEVVSLLQQDGEGGGGMVVLHGGQVVVADLCTVSGGCTGIIKKA